MYGSKWVGNYPWLSPVLWLKHFPAYAIVYSLFDSYGLLLAFSFLVVFFLSVLWFSFVVSVGFGYFHMLWF